MSGAGLMAACCCSLITKPNKLWGRSRFLQYGNLEATKILILRRDSEIIYWKNKDGKSPLYLAAGKCKFKEWRYRKGAGWEILQLLLQESPGDEDYAVKRQGMSPVLAALDEGKFGSGYFRVVLVHKCIDLLGRALLIAAGVPRSQGRDIRSLREQVPEKASYQETRAKLIKDQAHTRLLVATVSFAAVI